MYIQFPFNVVDQADIKAQFSTKAGFPNVIRVFNCTHIPIDVPSLDEHTFIHTFHQRTDGLYVMS